MPLFDHSKSVVVVTGAAGGIGLQTAKAFMGRGARVVLLDRADSVADIVMPGADDATVLRLQVDVCDSEQLQEAIARTVREFGRVDIVVNAHGVNRRKRIEEYTREDWDAILDVNLKSVNEIIRLVTPQMRTQKYGRIVNLASIQAAVCWNGLGRFSLAPYCASKAGLVALTKAYALELAAHGVTVNAICPGFVDTPLVAPLRDDAELYQDIVARTPVGRFARIDEIVAPILFLTSREASYVTGQAIFVDGGWTIQ
jgi:NAD(P)-dependent dehydrogenase (short-subunit alcohol dehydrogenase family)